jgi:hypothetical protein
MAMWPCGVVFNTASGNTVSNIALNTSPGDTVFSAILHQRIGSGPARNIIEGFTDTFLEIRRPTAVGGAMTLTAKCDAAAVRPVMGLILAMCLANPAGFPARPSPLRVDLRVKGLPHSMRNPDELIAPLRPLFRAIQGVTIGSAVHVNALKLLGSSCDFLG